MEQITNILMEFKISVNTAMLMAQVILLLGMLISSFLGNVLTKKVLLKVIPFYLKTHKIDWANIILEKKVFHYVSHFVSALIIYIFAIAFPLYQEVMQRVALSYILVVGIFTVAALLNSINEIYSKHSISKQKPIKGYIQIVKIAIFIVGTVVFVSIILDKSPLIFLSGIGALTAVFLLIFRDSLLGLVAGIQLSSNDMVRLGDWIEMPKYGADGFVTDISLNTVKVQNFDKTITTIPTYALISDSFKNWRGMVDAGGRRIKRAIYIDTSSINFCTADMIEQFKKIQYLADYIQSKEKEIENYNREQDADPLVLINGRHMTNIGTFRVYIENYLKSHPKIRKDMIQIVRQLSSGEYGLPLEVYAFTSDTDWVKHEAVQSDVFDHIFAIVPQFGLRIYQQPTGYDMRSGFRGKSL